MKQKLFFNSKSIFLAYQYQLNLINVENIIILEKPMTTFVDDTKIKAYSLCRMKNFSNILSNKSKFVSIKFLLK